MARWDNEDPQWALNKYPDAPCHTCVYRSRGDYRYVSGGAKDSCDKYPVPAHSTGYKGKPITILEGKTPCPYYKKS